MIAAALRIIRLRNLVRGRSSETLARMNVWLGALPNEAMPTLRTMVGEEILARELAALESVANETGPWRVVQCGMVN